VKKLNIGIVSSIVSKPFEGINKFIKNEISFQHFDINTHFQTLSTDTKLDILICHVDIDFFRNFDSLKIQTKKYKQLESFVLNFSSRNNCIIILNTIFGSFDRISGTDYFREKKKINKINGSLINLSLKSSNISLSDHETIFSQVGSEKGLNYKNGYVMKMPYTNHLIPELNKEYARLIDERISSRKKVIVVDADNTLWGGIVGEDGVEGIKIDDNYPGIIFKNFQIGLKKLKSNGFVLALASKNNEEDVKQVFKSRSMPLKYNDFIEKKVNWEPKSGNIKNIAESLNLGLDSFVFIDDNEFEIQEVKYAIPEVDCYKFNYQDIKDSSQIFSKIEKINTWSLSDEDKRKSVMYQQESKRKSLQSNTASIEDYIKSLQIEITPNKNNRENFKRISQLTNKTNQFNLTTKRYSEKEILEIMDKYDVYDFQVKDIYGDMGTICVVIVIDNEIDSFLLSCRAIGRKIEDSILSFVLNQYNGSIIKALYSPTKKNKQVENFFENHGFNLKKKNKDLSKEYAYKIIDKLPLAIDIKYN